MSLFGVICETHEECFLRNPSSVPGTSIFLLLHSCCISVPTCTWGMWVLPTPLIGVRYATTQSWGFLVRLRNKSDSWIRIWLCKAWCSGTLLRCCHPNRKKSNFSLNGAVITVGNFSLLPIIYLQRIFLKGTILENSVWLWCLQK